MQMDDYIYQKDLWWPLEGKAKKHGRPREILSSIYCSKEEMWKDFDLFIPLMHFFLKMNKEGYLWPICAFDVTCVDFSHTSLVEW